MGIETGEALARGQEGHRADSAGLSGRREHLEVAVGDATGRLPGEAAEDQGAAVRELDLPRVPAAVVHLGLFGPRLGPGVEGEGSVESRELGVSVVRVLVGKDRGCPR